jgi:hypothetical protein
MRFSKLYFLAASFASALRYDQRGRVDYTGYRVLRVSTPSDVVAFEEQFEELSAVSIHHHGDHYDIAVPQESIEAFEALDFQFEVLSEDLGADIAAEGELAEYPGLESEVTIQDADVGAAALPSLSWFNSYHAYADHLTFLRDLQGAFPSNSEIITAGTSFQGRAITGIHLWGSGGRGSKPAIYWHGNVHAREWVTSKVVEYLAYQIVVNYNNDTVVRTALDNYDFYILPVVNPDGFVYSQTTNRLWRKNRQTRSGTTAVGTDINRNWPYQWTGSGSSTSPSSETYRGVAAGDTPEVQGIRGLADTLSDGRGIKFYIDWHSYGQYLLLPYGYSCSARAPNHSRQQALATGYASAVRAAYGTSFTTGPTCSTLYQTNGGSNDYVQDVATAEFAWAVELRDTGSYGFQLPATQILPSGIEQWAAQKYLWQNF